MKIPFLEFQMRVAKIFPDAKAQDIAPAPYVHVFDAEWLQEGFWPVWGEVKRELNNAIPARPMANNARRGICDEITKRFISELTLSTRIRYIDEDVAPGVLDATVRITGEPLNRVSDGWHRCAIVATTKDGVKWTPVFVEPQLDYANYQTTDLLDAAGAGVQLHEHFI
jgi:hypothetical protein